MTPGEKFLREMRRDSRFAEQLVTDIAKALDVMELDGIENPDVKAHFGALEWIMNQPDSLDRRLKVIGRLFALPGKVENLNMRAFYALQ